MNPEFLNDDTDTRDNVVACQLAILYLNLPKQKKQQFLEKKQKL